MPVSDGLKALMQKHAEELEREQAAHRDALALCEVYEQRIAELKSAYKGLVELNKRNCDDALRIKGASDATLALAFLVLDDIKAKDAKIAELQNRLDAAREEIECITHFKTKEKNHGDG